MGDAMDLIHKGLDPLVDENGQEWEGGWNPKYSQEDYENTTTRSGKHGFYTWSQWQRKGRQVVKGSKGEKVNGVFTFSYNQTSKINESNDTYFSYDEWFERGYQVKKGQKGKKINGQILFNIQQTIELSKSDEYHYTFDEWQERGYQIIKGQKGLRINGTIVFSSEQVRKKY